VALPISWIKENNLKKGDEIEITQEKNNLVISAQKHPEHKKIEIDISNAKPMIRRIIGATFKTGYDEVNIKFSSYEELKAVQELIREQFMGFEIINQSRDEIKIKNISEENLEEFNNVLRRFFLVVNHMASETASAIGKDDFKWLKNNTLIKIESDKFADYCRRGINKNLQTELRLPPLYTIIEQLEKVVDRYKELCQYISENKIKTNKEIKEITKEVSIFQESFYNLFYRFEIKRVVELGKEKEKLQEQIDQLSLRTSKKEVKILMLLDRILNLTFDLNGPLMAAHI
jgi:phosphate uptake regulator